MKKIYRKVLIVLQICIPLLLSFSLKAQVDSLLVGKEKSDCEASLAVAAKEFTEGRFYSLPSILKSCLQKGFTKEQKIRAYILLCQVYLINDNPTEAEASYLKLLTTDPEYIAKPETDPIDVVYLSQKFTTRPVFTPHVKFGINTSFVTIIHERTTSAIPVKSSYSLKPSWSFGAGLDWNISDRIRFGFDVSLSNRRFQKKESFDFRNDRNEQLIRMLWLDVPFFLKYQDFTGKYRPYAYAGYGFHLSLSSSAQYKYFNIGGDGSQAPTEGPVVDLSAKQNKINQSIILGGGLRYKVGKNFLLADLRIQLGLKNVTKSSSILSDPSNTLDPNSVLYNIVVDDYRMNSVTLSLGYVFPFYSPRKKGGWQPGGLLGKILYGKNTTEK
jgi:Outer membrane protein beta-barrel domain